ncbi:hypothetical protein [Veronia nyctiphanis]|uniref:hypothetical protein n=1 Tax=Veronia nyctiphanis TaxID=1278244 RepID=UPI00100C2B38|nr:hypothetical protein [Veronia nyctiphanis]
MKVVFTWSEPSADSLNGNSEHKISIPADRESNIESLAAVNCQERSLPPNTDVTVREVNRIERKIPVEFDGFIPSLSGWTMTETSKTAEIGTCTELIEEPQAS